MKHKRIILIILLSAVLFLTCETDPLTGESNFYLFSDAELFAMSFEQYAEVIAKAKEEGKVLPNNDTRTMKVRNIGEKIQKAADHWYKSPDINQPKYLDNYKWEYNVIDEDTINAWCMPGGKIVVYTGILPLFYNVENNADSGINESMLATVMGHEVAHALLNHGKQRLSWSYVQLFGAQLLLWALGGTSQDAQNLFLAAYAIGTNVGLMLPFSRENESEADKYGLYLMAIADYDPDQSVPFWQRMAKGREGNNKIEEMLSTHPLPSTRIDNLNNLKKEAKEIAERIGKVK
jgi:predicted Zn-dependent protease